MARYNATAERQGESESVCERERDIEIERVRESDEIQCYSRAIGRERERE